MQTDTKAKWKAEREALKRDALSGLSSSNRDTSELLAIYEAARLSSDAWVHPGEHTVRRYSLTIWDREYERAWYVMEAIADELASRWPDSLAERGQLLAMLADWHWRCDDNPEIADAILKLLEDHKLWSRSATKAVAS